MKNNSKKDETRNSVKSVIDYNKRAYNSAFNTVTAVYD